MTPDPDAKEVAVGESSRSGVRRIESSLYLWWLRLGLVCLVRGHRWCAPGFAMTNERGDGPEWCNRCTRKKIRLGK